MLHGLDEAAWTKSSYSSSGNSDCVEFQRLDDGSVAVRDSKNPSLGAFAFTASEWSAFVRGAAAGEFGA